MSNLEDIFGSLIDSSRSISSQRYASPGIFTKALLERHPITSLIRDSEPYEMSLFTLNRQGEPEHVVPVDIASNGDARSNSEDTVETLCLAAQKLLQKFPMDGVNDRIDKILDNWQNLTAETESYEILLQQQRSQLEAMNAADEDRYGRPLERISRNTDADAFQSMIAEEEQVIESLESEIASMNAKIQQLDQKLSKSRT